MPWVGQHLSPWSDDLEKATVWKDESTVITGLGKGITHGGYCLANLFPVHEGGRYCLSVDAKAPGQKGTWSFQIQDYWVDGFNITPTDDWKHYEHMFTAGPDPEPNTVLKALWIFDQTESTGSWQIKNLRFDDLALEGIQTGGGR